MPISENTRVAVPWGASAQIPKSHGKAVFPGPVVEVETAIAGTDAKIERDKSPRVDRRITQDVPITSVHHSVQANPDGGRAPRSKSVGEYAAPPETALRD